jgi:hypothetical protein
VVVPVEEQVLGDGQLGDDGGLLVDAGHPLPPRVPVGEPGSRLAAERDDTLVRCLQSGEDGHEGGLARPVAPHQCVGLPLLDPDGGLAQGHGRPVRLRHSRRLGHGRRCNHVACRLLVHWSLVPHRDLSSLLRLGTPS